MPLLIFNNAAMTHQIVTLIQQERKWPEKGYAPPQIRLFFTKKYSVTSILADLLCTSFAASINKNCNH
jgi:hypothetical protein